MNWIKPAPLARKDVVALLSLASPPKTKPLLAQALRHLSQLDLTPRLGKHAAAAKGYLAGSDKARAQDLHAAWADPKIKAIFCTRGGYGCSRLLEQINLSLALQHPKILIGYSDITTLHLALQTQGLITFWGPMPATRDGLSRFARQWMSNALLDTKPLGLLPLDNASKPECLRPGRAQGRITGGTLSLVAASLGTAYEIDTQGKIVFLEDVAEEPYRLDRMLTQLLAAGKLQSAAGIVLGVFSACEPKDARRSWSVREVLADRLWPLGIPIFSGLAIGHIADQITLPYGVLARMDANGKRLEILESAVNRGTL